MITLFRPYHKVIRIHKLKLLHLNRNSVVIVLPLMLKCPNDHSVVINNFKQRHISSVIKRNHLLANERVFPSLRQANDDDFKKARRP